MGLFTKKQKIFDCPICDRQFDPLKDKGTHRQEHVRQIPEGEGEASGQFTWECACGPSGMKWTNDFSASTALGIHWHRSHGIPLEPPLDNYSFLSEMERKLGMR